MKWALAGAMLALLCLSTPAIGSFHDTLGIVPDRAFVLAMSGTSFNGLSAPDAPVLEAYLGERVRFVTLATEAHTFHLHGHPWKLSDGRVVDTFLVDADTPHAFDVPAGGADQHPGDWLYHCHIDAHLQAGMWGIFRVYPYAMELSLDDLLAGSATGMIVTLSRLGEPVDGASLALAVDGVDLPAHVEPLGEGRYAVHAPLPSVGALVVTASHPTLGESVARAGLGGAEVTLPTLAAVPHAHAP